MRAHPGGPLALLTALCVAGWAPCAPAQTTPGAPPRAVSRSAVARQELDRLLQWLDSVRRHAPGTGDAPAKTVAAWSPGAFEGLFDDLERLSAFLRTTRQSRTGPPPAIRVRNRRFTRAEVEAIFQGNETLTRGAVLHADIAVFVYDIPSGHMDDATDPGHVIVEDGRRLGDVRYGSIHWRLGRQVLDLIAPHPSADEGVRLWYRAVAARLLQEANLAEAAAHLRRARQIFPNDPFVLLDSAYLHQRFSSPGIQAAARQLRDSGASVAVESRADELERAARYFRQALAVAPDEAGARLRLGHTLGRLGRHAEAAAELLTALGGTLDDSQRYLAELFLGREEQALGRPTEARARYTNAAALYPRAQSPRLALSQLARQSGDRAGALEALQELTALPSSGVGRHDPWWDFYEPHAQDAGDLMRRMRALARADRR